MTDKQIWDLFRLMAKTTDLKRENIRSLYLDRLKERIVPFCVKCYHASKNASFRNDMVRFVIRYARISQAVRDLAVEALNDRSQKVRRMACAVMAYSLDPDMVPVLRKALDHKDVPTREFAQKAIDAIDAKDINLFVRPAYEEWTVTQDRVEPPTKEEVDRYIRKYAPDLIQPLTDILGSIYP